MDMLHFPGRDVPAYGEYASTDTLVEGRAYFVVHFLDADMTIPELKPMVYIGRNLEGDDKTKLYFQDAESYLAGVRFGDEHEEGEQGEIHTVDAETPFVYEFEHALDRLLYCALTRSKRPTVPRE